MDNMRQLIAVCVCIACGGVMLYPVLRPLGGVFAKLAEVQKKSAR